MIVGGCEHDQITFVVSYVIVLSAEVNVLHLHMLFRVLAAMPIYVAGLHNGTYAEAELALS